MDFVNDKIKFALDTPVTVTLQSWETNNFGNMSYKTTDGKFFDASKGLNDLLQNIPVTMKGSYTIEKKSSEETQYGIFHVNGVNLDQIKKGQGVPPLTTSDKSTAGNGSAQPPQTTAQAIENEFGGDNTSLVMRVDRLETEVNKLKESQLF